jgi:tyrosinase
MTVDIQINESANPNARFVSWAPSRCLIRMTNSAGATGSSANITLSSVSAATAGAVVFRRNPTGSFSSTITIPVPTSGVTVPFFVAGRFGRPSSANGDVTIQARAGATNVGSVSLMVRIRKNANTLTPAERDRFVAAFAQLNNQGLGRFADFRAMHTNASTSQAHFRPGFLPWHRAYILDLERELQAIDPSVALPYWRFDQIAPNLFTPDFIGTSSAVGTVQFSASNPLRFWRTDGVAGIDRTPFFNTATQSAFVTGEAATLNLGAGVYAGFRGNMEGDPHGAAHTSFDGLISEIPTAARDPLFFLLHCNVDRLWAKWQRQFARFDQSAPSYDNSLSQPGHKLADTMWPWNQITGGTRPPTAPGGRFAPSPCTAAPGLEPKVADCIDYLGNLNAAGRLGFSYDDVRL